VPPVDGSSSEGRSTAILGKGGSGNKLHTGLASPEVGTKRYSDNAMLCFCIIALRFISVENSYRFRLFAYDSYRSELAGQRYRFTSLLYRVTYASVISSREVTALILR
jgi:hypothetical protein